MDRLKDLVGVVTGGALGIGRATFLLCAREKAIVAVTDILDSEGTQLVREINASGGVAEYWHLDVAKEGEVKEVLGKIHKRFGKIDVLVNNAGMPGTNKPTHEVSEQEWDKLMAVNVKGVFFCTKHVIPYMKAVRRGSIINLSSIYGLVGAGDFPPYHASKGAVRLMTKNDALLYATDNIRVNSVHPGFVWTPMVENVAKQSNAGVKEFRKVIDAKHPLGHIGEPNDIAWGIVYLASEEAKFVTGAELVIDGGYTAQ
jgi:NAD(P)-dependent dehydrogenase (short-subunit alcohol dehydrogenase family)